jgi:hypothetical protein
MEEAIWRDFALQNEWKKWNVKECNGFEVKRGLLSENANRAVLDFSPWGSVLIFIAVTIPPPSTRSVPSELLRQECILRSEILASDMDLKAPLTAGLGSE